VVRVGPNVFWNLKKKIKMTEKAQTYGSKDNLGLVMIWFEFSKKKKKKPKMTKHFVKFKSKPTNLTKTNLNHVTKIN
jgi:hypothetical protein